MKWGSKKCSPSSSRTSSIITRVCPVSWLSKFKHKGCDPATDSKQNSLLPARWKEARFYSVDNDAYWSLSFREERNEVVSDYHQFPVSSFKNFGFREMDVPTREGFRSFDEIIFDKTKMKGNRHKENILRQNGTLRRKKPNKEVLTTLRKKDVNSRRSRKLSRGVVRKKAAELERGPDDGEECLKPVERDIFPIEPENTDKIYITREGHRRKMKKNQAKALAAKTECRIRVLEDMKKTRMKLKKEKKEKAVEDGTMFDSFAMVKSSFNPQQDFRDSMVEMISEKRIRRREDLEELLACYLTLNCDGYHDLIIKIFQQVWIELNGAAH
ncbi:hypothetical protein CDL12_05869 [Handroanthus impetiginosus]|uniref:Transcription repressor n=1 Tax=Handroanthus impetiginosus TaxID=429701 RepID=A0A2G9HVA9_9LAMI|nr:hypothetical protein CDL12_05869 [Handroanthus impetiginosus]